MGDRNYVDELTWLFDEDPEIDEIGMVYLEEENEAFVLAEHKLGISMTMIPVIHRQSKQAFFEARERQDVKTILNATRAMLLVCADFYTAWNARNTLITEGHLSHENEIKFMNIVLSLHAKSIDTWAHRRWVIQRFCSHLEGDTLEGFLAQELALCSKLCEQYLRNYFAWSYRYCIASKLSLPSVCILAIELLTCHLSDHSGWNYRHLLLSSLLNRVEDPLRLLEQERNFHSRLVELYPDREALWCYRRGILRAVAQHLSTSSAKETWPEDLSSNLSFHRALPLGVYIQHEVQFAASFQSDYALRYRAFALELIIKHDSQSAPPEVIQKHQEVCRELKSADSIRSSFWDGRNDSIFNSKGAICGPLSVFHGADSVVKKMTSDAGSFLAMENLIGINSAHNQVEIMGLKSAAEYEQTVRELKMQLHDARNQQFRAEQRLRQLEQLRTVLQTQEDDKDNSEPLGDAEVLQQIRKVVDDLEKVTGGTVDHALNPAICRLELIQHTLAHTFRDHSDILLDDTPSLVVCF
ncbi:hypothetical protein Ae201684P_018959 [Aphanomyces euteiches]|nr:hypothetical protein Ae201684P_018959 [Aphanomyces euteiches]